MPGEMPEITEEMLEVLKKDKVDWKLITQETDYFIIQIGTHTNDEGQTIRVDNNIFIINPSTDEFKMVNGESYPIILIQKK